MILDSGTSSSDTKIKDSNHSMKNSKAKILYIGIMCLATNYLSSIVLEVGSHGSFRSISPTRSAVFNNLLRRNYNLRIKVMVADILAALVSTIMLTIGDMYRIPYLYLPWLINTIEGIAFYEGPALFELAYTVLPNASMLAGTFMFLTLIFFVEELCIWKDVLVNFKRCWTNYNNHKLDTKSTRPTNKELCNENKETLNVSSEKVEDHQEFVINSNKYNNYDAVDPTVKVVKDNNLSIKNRHSKGLFTDVTG